MGGLISSFRSFHRDASVTKEPVKPGTAWRMVRFAAPYRGLLAVFLAVVVFESVVTVASPLIYRYIVDDGILKGNVRLTVQLALLAAAFGVASAALNLIDTYLSSKTGASVVLDLRTKLFEHVQRMPLAFFTRTQTGALVSRLNNDVSGAQTAFTDILSSVVGNLITVVLILGTMFALSWRITLLALVLLPIFVFPARYWGRKLQAIAKESYDLLASMNAVMVERFNVAGAQLAKLFGHPGQEQREFAAKAERVSAIGVKRAIYGRSFFSALMLVAALATALVWGWGGALVAQKALDFGTIVALVALLSRLYAPLMGLSNVQVTVMTALVSFSRVFEVLDLEPMIRESPRAIEIPPGPARIAFDRVSFRYPTAAEVSLASLEAIAVPGTAPEKTVLCDISFVAEGGQLVALVGPSGAGKTTITQLVSRLYDVTSGSVAVNGVDIREAKLASLRRRIGVVTQDAHLFHDTIRANLLYAKPEATEREIEDALRAAQILPLVRSLPLGLDTLVGERGYRFSGGEKQRLAIARLLLKAPDIVILDEATAHLDSESEAAIQSAFEVALAGRTSLVIAHRLSTILRADSILVLQEGRIVERGTHAELLERGGLYAELYQRQFSGAAVADGAASSASVP